MTRMQQDFKIFQKFLLDIFVIMVPLGMLSNYPDIDISHWLREQFQWIMVKVFRVKLMV